MGEPTKREEWLAERLAEWCRNCQTCSMNTGMTPCPRWQGVTDTPCNEVTAADWLKAAQEDKA